MITLNLAKTDKSDIRFKISRFPDGQQQVTIDGYNGLNFDDSMNSYHPVLVPIDEDKPDRVKILSRLNDFKDLELICCSVASLREIGVNNIELYVPYFLGSRSDRKFEEGSNNYLKTVICPIINNLKFSKVTVLDPHSDVLEACLNNFNKINNLDLVRFSLSYNISNTINAWKGVEKYLNEDCILISPDAGAYKKISKLADEIGYKGEVITCSKSRDVDGKLTKTEVPFNIQPGESNSNDKDLIIIDDICDGGATFINIAKEIRSYKNLGFNVGNTYLVVTHGVFSKGFEELNKYFDCIYCTNSYKDVRYTKAKVKQLDIF